MDIYGESAITISDSLAPRHFKVVDYSAYERPIFEEQVKQKLISMLGVHPSYIDVLNIGLPTSACTAKDMEDFFARKITSGVQILVSDRKMMSLADGLSAGYYIQTRSEIAFDRVTQCDDVVVSGVVFDSDSSERLLNYSAYELAKSRYTKNKKIAFTENPSTRILFNTTADYLKVVDILSKARDRI